MLLLGIVISYDELMAYRRQGPPFQLMPFLELDANEELYVLGEYLENGHTMKQYLELDERLHTLFGPGVELRTYVAD